MCFELLHFAILNRIGGACLCTGWFYIIFHAVITQRAFMRHMITVLITRNYSERASDNTIAAPIADILLHIDRIKLRANNSSRRACLVAWRICAMLAHITHHQPALTIEKRQRRPWGNMRNSAIALRLDYFFVNVG